MLAKKPNKKAVLISDVHFNLKNLSLSSFAVESALQFAEKNHIPLIIAGDLHDTKALLRGEVVKAMIDIFRDRLVPVYALTGNHDRIHEKEAAHSLEFLRPYVTLIDKSKYDNVLKIRFIPYQSDIDSFVSIVKDQCHPGDLVVMHQGVCGANMGDYIVDKSAIPIENLSGLVVFSGHYHKHQTVKNVTYIGNPYTMSFGEAEDGEKGFLVLNEDGSFVRHPLPLRRHYILSLDASKMDIVLPDKFSSSDLLWLKIKGSASQLAKIKKQDIQHQIGYMNFKMDKIRIDEPTFESNSKKTDEEVLDALIDNTPESEDGKAYLKKLWREVMNEIDET